MTRARQPRRRPAAIIVRMFLHRRLAWLGPALLLLGLAALQERRSRA